MLYSTGLQLLVNGNRHGDIGGLQVGIEQRGQVVSFGLGGEVAPIGQVGCLLSQLMVLGWVPCALAQRTRRGYVFSDWIIVERNLDL